MRLSFTKKLTVIFWLILIVIVMNGMISYGNTITLMHNQHWVIRSLQVMTQLERTLSAFNNTETAQRGYLITTGQVYLDAYLKGLKQTENNLHELQNITDNHPKEQKYIKLLSSQIYQSFKLFQQEVESRKKQNLRDAANLFLSEPQRLVTDDIQKLVQKFEAKEQKLLEQKIRQSKTSFQTAMTTSSIATCGDLGLISVLYYVLRNYLTRIKLTQQRLSHSENRLRAIIDAEPECIQLIAQDGTLLEINASGLMMLEVDTVEQVVGKSAIALIVQDYHSAFLSFHDSICRGYRGTLEYEVVGYRGTRRWMETSAVPLVNESDGTFLHLAVTRDITTRKLSEQKIREQAALLDVAVDGILVQDIRGKILYWNKGAERLYGWSGEEVLEKDASYLLYQPGSSQLEKTLAHVIQYGDWKGELQQVCSDDTQIIVESRWTLLRDEKGNPKSILTVNTDITEKKQLETQLMRSQRLESIGTLAGGIAHDLNNVLSPILMSIQLLQMKLGEKEQQKLLKTLENNVKRGADLVKQVLSFARGMESKRIVVDVKQLIAEIEQIVTEAFPKSIVCQVKIAPTLNYVCGDTTQLHQVLMNLVVNARDAMENGGYLRISAENFLVDQEYAKLNLNACQGTYLKIVVEDTGIGIPQSIQERIFEPFFTTKDIGKGTGLGLSTTIGIIKSHGGFVNVHSQVGKGTQIQVYLPACDYGDVSSPTPEVAISPGNGELILVVDDELAIRKVTQSTLEAFNYRVLTASDGVEAMTVYAQNQQDIDLILLDMMMHSVEGAILPGSHSVNAIHTLKQINPDVKIIAISGLLSNHNVNQAKELGVKAFLSKPCTANELLDVIQRKLVDS
ncbi:PAS domain S-box protein [Calothrix sp. PCC 6303]|uniref:PAS domain S-box protein n=1 Tax=Calothrix sp. PCC 6303 TaxID=1170562 RepID=UPI0002A047CB|nr:PAS domain S-box protein [Calothrix sp. PCC 6303]AFZ00517.1 PAS/PAC sensor hybrid histidine kinase [Calothrix sp. PCC 6303]